NTPPGIVPSGTLVNLSAPIGQIYYTVDTTDPRLPGGGISPSAILYTGSINVTSNIGVFARAYTNPTALWTPWGPPVSGTYVIQTHKLVITEIMYHPAPPPTGTNIDEDFEYVELKNIGSTPINLNNVRLRGGVDVLLSSYLLNPGCYGVIVANTNA